MALIQFSDFKPDLAGLDTNISQNILNVVPRADGYGPFKSFEQFTTALPGKCRGFFYARKSDGSIATFAGTVSDLYLLNNTDFTWTNVSKGGVSYPNVPTGDQWQFAQFNNLVFATQINTALQVYDLTSSTDCGDALGSPPQARYIAIINRFLVLSGLSASPYRVQWSGVNNVNASTSWDNLTLGSNFQDLPDGGIVRTVAGSDQYGIIFQDASIRSMIFAPGTPEVFYIQRISKDDGIFAPLSAITSGDKIFFLSPQGFKSVVSGGYPTPIGNDRVDRTFFADVDTGNLELIIGANDPKTNRVFWCYKSLAGNVELFDTILCYDWTLSKWTKIRASGEYLTSLARPGLTLENLDAISGSIDALTFSLDAVTLSSQASLSAVDSTHIVGFFNSLTNLEATLETPEQNGQGRRMLITSIRPQTDASTAMCSVAGRDSAQAAATYSTETAIGVDGRCPQRVDTRYARAKMRIPAGSTWTYAMGVDPEYRMTGSR